MHRKGERSFSWPLKQITVCQVTCSTPRVTCYPSEAQTLKSSSYSFSVKRYPARRHCWHQCRLCGYRNLMSWILYRPFAVMLISPTSMRPLASTGYRVPCGDLCRGLGHSPVQPAHNIAGVHVPTNSTTAKHSQWLYVLLLPLESRAAASSTKQQGRQATSSEARHP